MRLNPVPTPPKRPRDCITCSPRGVRRLCAGAQARRGCSDVDPCQRCVVEASARLDGRLGQIAGSARESVSAFDARQCPSAPHGFRARRGHWRGAGDDRWHARTALGVRCGLSTTPPPDHLYWTYTWRRNGTRVVRASVLCKGTRATAVGRYTGATGASHQLGQVGLGGLVERHSL